jgi:hypothetical protein
MKLDVRTPIGAMFALYGAILLVYSFIADQSAAMKKTGLNANMIWGVALLFFGGIMLGLVLRGRAGARASKPGP